MFGLAWNICLRFAVSRKHPRQCSFAAYNMYECRRSCTVMLYCCMHHFFFLVSGQRIRLIIIFDVDTWNCAIMITPYCCRCGQLWVLICIHACFMHVWMKVRRNTIYIYYTHRVYERSFLRGHLEAGLGPLFPKAIVWQRHGLAFHEKWYIFPTDALPLRLVGDNKRKLGKWVYTVVHHYTLKNIRLYRCVLVAV